MISDADRSLERLLQRELGTPLPFDLSFAVPDNNFAPLTQSKNTLNCYLYEISEDRDLRSNQRVVTRYSDGFSETDPPPARIKLSYVVTAWSPAAVTTGVFPTLDEHRLLSDVLTVLLRYPILPPDVLVGRMIDQAPEPPTTVVSAGGGTASSDFWNAIDGQLRPSLDFSITISLDYQPTVVGDMVRSAAVDFGGGEALHMVGGTVLGSAALAGPVAGAWLRVDETGATYVTDDDGRYVTDSLIPGSYTFRVRATGFSEQVEAVDVPQADGNYDVTLIPL